MQAIPGLIIGAVIVVIVGFVLYRILNVKTPATAVTEPSFRRYRESDRKRSRDNDDSTTVWIGALEAGMALVMVLATLAITDAASTPKPGSDVSDQVLVDAMPEIADQQASSAPAAGGSALVHPTHRLVPIESTAADTGAIIIELDAPLPADRPVKFLINTPSNSSPQ